MRLADTANLMNAAGPVSAGPASAVDTACFFALLHRYYAHQLTCIHADEWATFLVFAEEPLAQANPAVKAAIQRIAATSAADANGLEYEFNRLFVGPEKLLAAPFETVYRSDERVLMRQATLSVRQAYEAAGVQVAAKNAWPDDHAAYECAFMAELAARCGSEDALKVEAAQEAYAAFAAEHLARWVPGHVAAIRANTRNQACLGFADLLEALTVASHRGTC